MGMLAPPLLDSILMAFPWGVRWQKERVVNIGAHDLKKCRDLLSLLAEDRVCWNSWDDIEASMVIFFGALIRTLWLRYVVTGSYGATCTWENV